MKKYSSKNLNIIGLNDMKLHNCIAEMYDKKLNYLCARLFLDYSINKLIKNINGYKKVIIDVGCGTGILCPYISDRCYIYIGLDQSAEMIKLASKKNKKSTFLIGDGENLPFKEGSISTIICRGSLHHMANPNQALNEFYRVLEPFGSLVMAEPNNLNIFMQFLRWIMANTDKNYSNKQKQFNPNELKRMLEEVGFDGISTQHVGYISNLLDFPEKIAIFKYINRFIIEKIFGLDDLVSECKFLNEYSWGIYISALKDNSSFCKLNFQADQSE